MSTSPVCLTQQQREHCKTILNFWHKLEFFIPFDLEGQVLGHKDAEWAVSTLAPEELTGESGKGSAGAHPPLWQVPRVPDGMEVTGFELYLGVFDTALLASVTQAAIAAVLDGQPSEAERHEQTERADVEGRSCYAKIRLSARGTPMLDQVSVSTVPWALGQVAGGQLAALDMQRFDASLKHLQDDLHNFKQARLPASAPGGAGQDAGELPLTRSDIGALLAVFYAWAGFTPPPGASAVVLRARAGKARRDTKPVGAQSQQSQQSQQQQQLGLTLDEAEDEADDAGAPEIDILNSFYARDLRAITQAIDRGEIGPAMLAYLTPLLDAQRTDLYSAAGRERIVRDLHPRRTPPAQWLGEPEHAMSLMQQFAINNISDQLGESGLFSVNGPPGTGKTTLLRDLIADNITRRALVLAGFDSAAGALVMDDKLTVDFDIGEPVTNVVRLQNALCGFEMVVASSNNAAVQNISRDLPKARSIGAQQRDSEGEARASAWRHVDGSPKIAYLQQVAHRIAAQNSKGEFVDLGSDDTPWALISATLGNRSNRRAFAAGLSYPAAGPGTGKPPKGYDKSQHKSIWEWREGYRGLNFAQAKKALLAAQAALLERRQGLEDMIALLAQLGTHTGATWTAPQSSASDSARRVQREAQDAAAQHALALEAARSTVDGLDAIHASLQQERPAWWARWLKRAAYAAFGQRLADNRQSQRLALERRIALEQSRPELESRLRSALAALTEAEHALQEKRDEWKALQAQLSALAARYPQAQAPGEPDADAIEAAQWQRDGVWRDPELNKRRAALFAAALALQQAWLWEVLQSGAFSKNVFALSAMLSGKRVLDPAMALVLWQSLFMVAPVISSTFASIADQFRGLGSEALGWLFIDEAGQAVPQAAPGAIWRCKRVVVVGDPMQIEPVFTVPIRLIDALAATSHLPIGSRLKPHQASVQTLSDAANSLGAWVSDGAGGSGERQWIGSPLRVHRRCVEPMFGIANAIAYNDKMVYGLASSAPPPESLDLGASAWVQVGGSVSYRQAVPAQTELVLRALLALYEAGQALPPLYIITPFKAVKAELIEALSDVERWRALAGPQLKLPTKTALRAWCRSNVGTVHTFQGKEEELVWLVLGGDASTVGAINWAAQKPNLLNVALTRARHRVFLIGDAALWSGKRFFQNAAPLLPAISAAEFERRCSAAARARVGNA